MTAIITTQEKIARDQFNINQSKIKRLAGTVVCPLRYRREEVTGEDRRVASLAMIKGQYLEYRLWGTPPKEGGIPVIPPLRNGKPSVDQIRIDVWVEKIPRIFEDLGIKIVKTDMKIEVPESDINFHGTMDVIAEWKGKPYILDLKCTGNVHNDYGDFGWGKVIEMHPDANGMYIAVFDKGKLESYEHMDFIQAYAYMYQLEKLTSREWGFLYAVFDYKPKSEYKIIEVMPSEEGRINMLERLELTKHKLKRFLEWNYEPIPSKQECDTCKFLECSSKYIEEEAPSPKNEPEQDILLVQAKTETSQDIIIDDDAPW